MWSALRPLAKHGTHEDARRIVLDAFADDHGATAVHDIEDAIDRVAGGGVRAVFVATPQPLQRVQRGILRGTHKIKLDGALPLVGDVCG